ncbi:6221_t:CDS:2 [Funneliformis geosporum]|uniref:15431_t:CDS:1 n=1 Tax=Funneliformis geosporum TaxID=1117311 RepID=A0A9W4SMC8_9GLOM|nr:6221_t:CDS:2 [Funneliformis geosporum]CAI2174394.1 15431_t:CDS:2 [Funneliformis geosporum]
MKGYTRVIILIISALVLLSTVTALPQSGSSNKVEVKKGDDEEPTSISKLP